MKQRILVTGGCGYIGSVLVSVLLERGYRVRVFDKLYFGDEPLSAFADSIELVPGDVRTVDESVLESVWGVAHLGSLSNDPTSEFHPEASQSINYEGTLRLARACKKCGVQRFTFASSAAVYGFWLDTLATEDQEPLPQSAYAKSKVDAERALFEMSDATFQPVALRQATVFGLSPRMRWDIVLNAFVMHAFRTGRLDVWFGGEAWRPFVHVRDVSLAHLTCLEAPAEQVAGQVFNVVQENYVIRDVAERVIDTMRCEGLACEMVVNRDRKDARSYRASGEKLASVTGFRPTIQPEDGAREILAALRAGKFTDFDHPVYYNMPWLTLLLAIEQRFAKTGRVF